MAGFLSDAFKQVCNDIISESAATWEVNISIFKDADRAFIVNDPEEFNFGYRQQYSVSQEYTPVSGTFPARVWWRLPNVNDLDVDTAMKGELPKTFCRLKLRQDGYNFLLGVRSVIIDNIVTYPDFLSPRPHGMFGAPQFFDIICNKVQ